jgi:Bifunctional DNA primase/polymerase, N-terminal
MTTDRWDTRLREELLSAALAHAGRGWHVFPLRPGGKRPALHGEDNCPRTGPCHGGHRGWEQRATTDPARIHACWTHGPAFNVGLACGRSGLIVIDLDVPKPGQQRPRRWAKPGICDGADVLADLCETCGQPWPSGTFTVRTGRGGTHLYFTAPPGRRLGNTAGRLGWCIDTRAHGGYVLAAGSATTSGRYTIVNDTVPMILPAWLGRQLAEPPHRAATGQASTPLAPGRSARYARAALAGEARRVATATVGRRNDTLNRAAFNLGQLTATGLLPPALAYTALTDAARRAGLDRDPGCGPRGIEATIRSGLAAGARKPRTRAA